MTLGYVISEVFVFDESIIYTVWLIDSPLLYPVNVFIRKMFEINKNKFINQFDEQRVLKRRETRHTNLATSIKLLCLI